MPHSPGPASSSGGTPLGELLHARTATAGALLRRAAWLRDIQDGLHAELAATAPWALSLRVANIRSDVLILHAENASAAQRARLMAPQILELVNHRHGLRCGRLEAKSRPGPRIP